MKTRNTLVISKYYTIDRDGNEMKKPVFTNPETGRGEKEAYPDVDIDFVYEWLLDYEKYDPATPSYEILRQTNLIGGLNEKDNPAFLCIEGLMDNKAAQWFRLESAVKEYGVDILNIDLSQFEAFETVRANNNLYENIENFKREKEMSKGTK